MIWLFSTLNYSFKKYEKLSIIDKEFSLGKVFVLNCAKNLVTITINIEFYSSFDLIGEKMVYDYSLN